MLTTLAWHMCVFPAHAHKTFGTSRPSFWVWHALHKLLPTILAPKACQQPRESSRIRRTLAPCAHHLHLFCLENNNGKKTRRQSSINKKKKGILARSRIFRCAPRRQGSSQRWSGRRRGVGEGVAYLGCRVSDIGGYPVWSMSSTTCLLDARARPRGFLKIRFPAWFSAPNGENWLLVSGWNPSSSNATSRGLLSSLLPASSSIFVKDLATDTPL